MSWFIFRLYIEKYKHQRHSHLIIVKLSITYLIIMYIVTNLFYDIPESYKNLSSNMVLMYFPKLISYYWKKILYSKLIEIEQAELNRVKQMIRAPSVDISRPLVTLERPIKHVFLIILESIRADALPLNQSLADAVKSVLSPGITADNIAPLLNSFWKRSVHTVGSVTSSYTLKSLLSIFCGLYPLNVNFLKEYKSEVSFYEKCLPELLREMFPMVNNQSAFRSAFFTAARDDFDHQQELVDKIKFDTVINGYDIYKEIGRIPDLGMFGPPDPYILPPMWKWIDQQLTEQPTQRLMMSLLVTGTHEPFPIADEQFSDEYQSFIYEPYVNRYLNTLRITDKFLQEIIKGLMSRNLYNDTLFVVTSDHGYVFNDHGREVLGLLSSPLESAFSVPLMFYNPYLQSKQLDGQFTTMDILPTIMDVLLSSSSQQSANHLLSVPRQKLQSILERYEGTSLLRMPIEKQPVRYTFQLANPGNSYIIVKQYPNKLTYNIENDQVHLYNLKHDPLEFIDLMAIEHKTEQTYPSWIDTSCKHTRKRQWKGRWDKQKAILSAHQNSLSSPHSVNHSHVKLADMLEWADQTFELARLWKNLIKQRYHYESDTINTWNSQS